MLSHVAAAVHAHQGAFENDSLHSKQNRSESKHDEEYELDPFDEHGEELDDSLVYPSLPAQAYAQPLPSNADDPRTIPFRLDAAGRRLYMCHHEPCPFQSRSQVDVYRHHVGRHGMIDVTGQYGWKLARNRIAQRARRLRLSGGQAKKSMRESDQGRRRASSGLPRSLRKEDEIKSGDVASTSATEALVMAARVMAAAASFDWSLNQDETSGMMEETMAVVHGAAQQLLGLAKETSEYESLPQYNQHPFEDVLFHDKNFDISPLQN